MLSVLRRPRSPERSFLRTASVVVAVLAVGFLHADPASATATFHGSISGGVLTVTGTGGDDQMALRLRSGDPATLDVVDVATNTVVLSFARAAFNTIHVSALGGSDSVTVDESNGIFTDTDATTVDGGGDDDTLRGGSGSEVLVGGTGNDVVIGGRGDDVALLGDGRDTFFWNPGDGSDTVEGQADVDTLQFNGANVNENVVLSANGSRVRLTRDVGAIVMDLNGVEDVNFAALGGADNTTVGDLTGTGVTNVNVDLASPPGSGAGDGQADTVVVDGTNGVDNLSVVNDAGAAKVLGAPTVVQVTGGESVLDTLRVDGLAGNDVYTQDPAIGSIIGVVLDGGADIDTVTTNGTSGADTFSIGAAGSNVLVGNGVGQFYEAVTENLRVNGLGGNDTITGGNGIALLTSLTIDGGGGNDTLIGGDGSDVIVGGKGNDVVAGGRGNDVALMGAGNDTFVWNPGDGSDTVEGQDGTDVLDFNGANVNENVALSANGSRLRFTRDVAAIVMDVNGVETADFNALGGADNVTVDDLTGTGVTHVNVDLASPPGSGTGDGQADDVIVNGTNGVDKIGVSGSAGSAKVGGLAAVTTIAGAEFPTDRLDVNTLAGADTVHSHLAPNDIRLFVDGVPS